MTDEKQEPILDESLLSSEKSFEIDYSDINTKLEQAIEDKETKLNEGPQETTVSEQTLQSETVPERVEQVEEPVKTVKKESTKPSGIVLEEDFKKEINEKPVVVEDEDEEDLLDSILEDRNSIHIDVEEQENGESTSEDDKGIIIDEEMKETIEAVVDTEESIEKIKEREKRIAKRTGFSVYGGSDGSPAGFSSDNPLLKRLGALKLPAEKIVSSATDDESTELAFVKQYLQAESSPVVSPRITRFPVLLSGYYAEMVNYKYGEIAGLLRVTRNPELRFLRRFTEELTSLYSHISWSSLKKDGSKITFDEWVEGTMLPDLDQFYYGAFDATYPGDSNYTITCGNCRNEFTVTKKNRELCYALQNGGDESVLNDKFIKDVLLQKISKDELKFTPVYIKAHELYEGKVIYPNQMKISYGVPTILDALEYLMVFEELLSSEYEDFNGLMDEESDDHNVLKLYTYIKKITLPVTVGKNAEGKDIIRFHTIDATVINDEKRIENRRNIIKILNSLPKDQFAELFTGKDVAEKVRLVGIKHMLNNITCPECNKNIIRVPIDMSVSFFTEAAQTVDRIVQF